MRHPAGFTLIEILIAISILTIGILGVISLFPVAIQVGSEAITNSLSADLSRSVEENIRSSARHRKYVYTLPGDTNHILTAFIYEHDGVYDPDVYKPDNVRKDKVRANTDDLGRRDIGGSMPSGTPWALDNVVLYPADNSPSAAMGYSGDSALDARRRSYHRSKIFVYPEGDPSESTNGKRPNGGSQGNPMLADNDKDDFQYDFSMENVVNKQRELMVQNEEWPLRVTRTFRFGVKVGERLAESPGDATLYAVPRRKDDPYQNYSYAFAIRRAFEDGNLDPVGRKFVPANELYEVKIMIFRGFKKETQNAVPIYSSTFLLSR